MHAIRFTKCSVVAVAEKMFYDLNVVWTGNANQMRRNLSILSELGYQCVALNYVVSGKIRGIESPFTDAVMKDLEAAVPKMRLVKRLTICLDDSSKNQSFASLTNQFDLVAVQPASERALQSAATALDIDLISVDVSNRLPFYLRHKTVCAAIERGIRFELRYAAGIEHAEVRRHTIANAAAVIRASRGRGIVTSSGLSHVPAARAPLDVVNLVTVWGLKSSAARDSVEKEAQNAVLNGKLRVSSAKQAIAVDSDGHDAKRMKLR